MTRKSVDPEKLTGSHGATREQARAVRWARKYQFHQPRGWEHFDPDHVPPVLQFPDRSSGGGRCPTCGATLEYGPVSAFVRAHPRLLFFALGVLTGYALARGWLSWLFRLPTPP